uniref:Uncharacterized protein n=1 Tax=Panagrolaimus superbus TaxID=310955 RepID=A0A914XY77_9BILA
MSDGNALLTEAWTTTKNDSIKIYAGYDKYMCQFSSIYNTLKVEMEDIEIGDDSEFGCIFSDSSKATFKPNVSGKLPRGPLFEFNSHPIGGFPDIPEHEKYLIDCKFLDDSCYSNITALVTERYRDHAIVYLMSPARRPAVIFCCCIENFDDVQLGGWLNVTANLLEMPFNETDERLFNLYCTNVELDSSPFLPESEVKDGLKIFLNDVHIEFTPVSQLKQCQKGWIFYGNIGSILIRHEYSPMFNIQQGHFVGNLRSMIQGVGKNEFLCWMLCPTFNVYKRNKELYQKCIDNVYQPVAKRQRKKVEKPKSTQFAFKNSELSDKKKKVENDEPPPAPVVIETLPPRPQKNVGELLGEIFFKKR